MHDNGSKPRKNNTTRKIGEEVSGFVQEAVKCAERTLIESIDPPKEQRSDLQ